MQLLLQRMFDGLTLGAIYGVVAVALVLIFKATTLINFAQGELAMFGAFIAYVLAVEQGLNIVLAIALAMGVSAMLGATIERVLLRPFDPAAKPDLRRGRQGGIQKAKTANRNRHRPSARRKRRHCRRSARG